MTPGKQNFKKIFVLALGLSVILLIVLCLHYIPRTSGGNVPPLKYFSNGHRRHPISKSNVSHISAWMTFDYINRVFELPDTYLKDTLAVESKKYPLITLTRYAREENLDPSTLVQRVKNAVEQYLNAQPPK